jgi:hypothetical protein
VGEHRNRRPLEATVEMHTIIKTVEPKTPIQNSVFRATPFEFEITAAPVNFVITTGKVVVQPAGTQAVVPPLARR